MANKINQNPTGFEKFLMRGNQAVGEGAIRAGCRYFFGYPITPQNDIPEFLSGELPKIGGVVRSEATTLTPHCVWRSAGEQSQVTCKCEIATPPVSGRRPSGLAMTS